MKRRVIFFLIAHASVSLSSQTGTAAYGDAGSANFQPDMVDDDSNWSEHPCRRDCEDDTPPMECYYSFRLEAYRTMSKACYACPFNATDCFREHCVPADGIERSVLVVNRQMPGPAIEVCQGDKVTVDVLNLLASESTTIHWHGQHHVRTPYMDGVPYVSQCPVPPGATFRYDFVATEAGTHFWHSHTGLQRGDGVFGALIVRVPPTLNWHRNLYRFDEHTIVVTDWTHRSGIDQFLDHHHAGGDNKPPSILVNGLGRYVRNETETANNRSSVMPIATFTVEQNTTYRFRLINAEFLNCPIEMSIDDHSVHVVSSDGRDIQPVKAESLVSYAGERFDFLLEANRPAANYWIRFRGLMDCDERFTRAYQVAILRYEGAPMADPTGTVAYDRRPNLRLGQQVNALNRGTETDLSVSVPRMKAMDENDEANSVEPDHQFYVSYDFYGKDNPHFHRGHLYGFHQVRNSMRVLTPQLNHISMKLPSVPLLPQRDALDQETFCNSSTVRNCEQDYCACTHVLRVKLGSVVEVILVDEGFAYDANHPFHLHGYQFRVVAMERVGKNVTVDEVKALDRNGNIRRNLDRAPLKDTVTVPDGGYTVLRFHANNPGYWLFHCHIEFHAEVGMSLVFKVGEHSDMVPVPRNFPSCGDYRPTADDSEHRPENRANSNVVEEQLRLFVQILRTLSASTAATYNLATVTTTTTFILLLVQVLAVVRQPL